MSATGRPSDESVTALLARMSAGDGEAMERLMPLVYEELRQAARRAIAREQPGHSLQATELAHEAYFKLVGADGSFRDRGHFLGVAARAMRQVLVEHARRRLADKRGGGVAHVTLGNAAAAPDVDDAGLVALDDALERLGQLDPALRALVEQRYFAGLSERDIAELQGVSERTVQRHWARARAWLHKELYTRDDPA
ncbi:MAG: ECF-type sigma factor [Gemmatimonadota bacterium]